MINGINSSSCPICQDEVSTEQISKKNNFTDTELLNFKEIDQKDKTPLQITCNHLFHTGCINAWFLVCIQSKKLLTCPVCRIEIPLIEIQSDEDELMSAYNFGLLLPLILFIAVNILQSLEHRKRI